MCGLWENHTVEKAICKKVQGRTIRKLMVVGLGGGGGEVQKIYIFGRKGKLKIHERQVTLTEIFSTGLQKFIQEKCKTLKKEGRDFRNIG